MVAELHSLISKESGKRKGRRTGFQLPARSFTDAAAERDALGVLPKKSQEEPVLTPQAGHGCLGVAAVSPPKAPGKMLREKGGERRAGKQCTACAASANPFSAGPRHMVARLHLLTQYPGRALGSAPIRSDPIRSAGPCPSSPPRGAQARSPWPRWLVGLLAGGRAPCPWLLPRLGCQGCRYEAATFIEGLGQGKGDPKRLPWGIFRGYLGGEVEEGLLF